MLLELSTIEKTELKELETIIDKNMTAFHQVGSALAKIRDSRLYRDTHSTFEDYCKDKWDMSRPRAYQFIESSLVHDNLSTIVDIQPTNEAQTRPLTKLKPEQQKEAWQKVIDTAPEGKITAHHVSMVVSGIKKESTENEIEKQVNKKRAFVNRKLTEDELRGNLELYLDKDMKTAFDNFYREIQRIRLEKWSSVTKEAALYMIELTKSLIEA